jgi:hypothetical protein
VVDAKACYGKTPKGKGKVRASSSGGLGGVFKKALWFLAQ